MKKGYEGIVLALAMLAVGMTLVVGLKLITG